MHPALSKILAAGAVCLASGCFAVTDLDRFEKGGGSSQFDDLRLTVRAMSSHVDEYFEFRVVDANNVIQSRGILKPLGGVDISMSAPLAIPKVNGPFRLDFFADHNASGGYDGPDPNDHSWRIDPLADFPADSTPGAATDGVVNVVFEHNRSFTDLREFPRGTTALPTDTNVPATVRFTNMAAHTGKLVQARVRDALTGHTAGLYRTKATAAAFELVIPGVIDAGVDYDVEIWIDANGSGAYEKDADLGYRVRRPSDRAGMTLDFDPAIGDSRVDVGTP